MTYREVKQLDEEEIKELCPRYFSNRKNTKDAEGDDKDKLLALLKQKFL
ncbi:MAG: hypothetical protein KAX33_12415 [Candidatus Lokiarchaeota archaeon]|nr:hypothetical protein [Candidatus Lokiarchaeota archaeon]MCK4281045.1 hypothetical protein [Candidatus Lokiarchaeota archaeon]